MPLKIVFREFNASEDGLRFYVSSTPIDPGNPPVPVDETGDSTTLTDESALFGANAVSHTVSWDETQNAFVRVAAFKGDNEVASQEWYYEADGSQVPLAGLDFWYPLTNVSGGTVPDAMGTYDGQLMGGATVVAGALGGSAIDFDGDGDYLATGYRTSGGSYTLSLWVKPRSLNTTDNPVLYAEVSNTANDIGAFLWVTSSNQLEFGHFKQVSGNYDGVSAGDFSLYTGGMVHVCVVREDGVAHRVYLNGELAAEGPCTSVTGQASYPGTLGGNPDAMNPGPRWFDGIIERDVRMYNRVLDAAEVQQLYAEHAADVPFTLDENFVFTDEGDDLTPWSQVSGSNTVSTAGSEVYLPAGSSSSPSTAKRSLSIPAMATDSLIFVKMRASYLSGKHAYLLFLNGSTQLLYLNFGYDWVAGATSLGTVSVLNTVNTVTRVLETGVDYSAPREYAIHIDRKFDQISFYLREPTGWKLLNSMPYFSAFGAANEVRLVQGASSGDMEIALDYLSWARPNFASIGDSITAGHNFFDPDPTFYAGIDDVRNSWQGHFQFAGLRNNFVVNKGVGSNTSAMITSRIGDAAGLGAKYVFVQASNNDASGVPQSTRTSSIQGSVDAVTASGARCVLYNAIYPNANNANHPGSAAYAQDWWENYRSQVTGVYQAIDVMAALADGAGYIDPAYCESDGIHPNAAGFGVMGDYFQTTFSHTE
ncbi:LamG-like jellyroll fold domain-containing protein [Halomonas sp. JS92-SW72]|uniref:LamG-like jellyroll fold domain-containing protein n=1 Tax=Halomonas sp. JS92-SW72 TaxID=2306583 RepID=UPI000E5B677E|nr:LamG-like jellyroll fold domain-containing protein [Halomonas sp. JS92-SW72]AXY41589.1 hypothetical protein D1793_04915 [Halomonas sp. JS92-SW72]